MVMLLAAWLLGIQAGSGQNVIVSPPPGVVLEVTMPSGSVNRLTIPSRKHGSVGAVNGPGLDLAPTLKEDGSLELVVTPIAGDPATGSFTSADLEREVLRPGDTAAFGKATFPIAVKWLETVSTTASSGSRRAGDSVERCCVACGSEIVCGCRVVTPCGDCCAVSCGCQDGSASPVDAKRGGVRSLFR
jgi:hypothetical protein